MFSPEQVEKRLSQLNVSKSPGPDQLHPRVLREASKALSAPFAIIMSESYATAQLPQDWKQAHVSAIHKKGSKVKADNYRPVSLTSIVVKLMEAIVRMAMISHMQQHDLFTKYQFGFIPSRSTVLQLLTVLDKWSKSIDEQGSVDVLYFDFMKAFDRVPHKHLLTKLSGYGFVGATHTWIKNFLLGRRQRIKVGQHLSKWYPVSSGIPQGSVLGPLLFVLFINDLPDVVKYAQTYLFADDLKLFMQTSSEEDSHRLQEDINSIHQWSETNLLALHPGKCKSMHIASRPSVDVPYTYQLNGAEVAKSELEKDIGVLIDQRLSFQDHMHAKINKANSILGVILRTMEYKDETSLLTLYKALVRPQLEYCNQVWSPYMVKDIIQIESVQRRMTRAVPGLKDLEYEERLRTLKLPTLSYRRLRGDLIEAYKILTLKYDPAVTQDLLTLADESRTRGHHLKLKHQTVRTSRRKSAFFVRVVEPWNRLPPLVVEAPSVKSFERRLDKFLEHHPIRYDYRASPSLGPPNFFPAQELTLEAH